MSSPAGFEPTAFRLGELQSRMAAKARRCLEKPKKTSNLGKNRHCLLYSFKSLYDSILMQCTVKMQSKVQSFNGDMWTIVELLRYDLQTVFNMILPSEPPCILSYLLI